MQYQEKPASGIRSPIGFACYTNVSLQSTTNERSNDDRQVAHAARSLEVNLVFRCDVIIRLPSANIGTRFVHARGGECVPYEQ